MRIYQGKFAYVLQKKEERRRRRAPPPSDVSENFFLL